MKKYSVIFLVSVLGLLLGKTPTISSAQSSADVTTAAVGISTSTNIPSSRIPTTTSPNNASPTPTKSTGIATIQPSHDTTSTNASSTVTSTKQPSINTSLAQASTVSSSSTQATSSVISTSIPSTTASPTGTSSTEPSSTDATSTQTSPTGTSTKPSSANTSTTQTSPTGTSSTKPSSANISTTQTSPTGTSSTKPSSANTSTTQTSPTGTSSTKPSSAGTTSTQSSSVSTSRTPTTPAPKETAVVINEFTYTGLFKNQTSFFVEIKRLKKEQTPNITVVVLNGEKEKDSCLFVALIPDSEAWNDDELKVINMTLPEETNLHAVIVALYTDVDWQSCQDIAPPATSLADAVVVSQEPDLVPQNNLQTFVPMFASRILIADPSKFSAGGPYSVSRCLKEIRDPGSFIVSYETRGKANTCKVQKSNQVTMMFNNSKCSMFKDEELKVTISGIVNHLVSKLGGECQCGLSPVLFTYVGFDCSKSTLKLSLGATSETQASLILSLYTAFVNRTKCFSVTTNSSLCLTKECKGCGHLPKPVKNGNIGVTVGVVIGCIAIFIVIIVIVVLYIRKRRRGILQFRMTRLDEDDDDLMIAPDMDDFIGGGQDASFSNPMYTRFKS